MQCAQCSKTFDIAPPEAAALRDRISPVFNGKKYSIPDPILCPSCSLQLRMAFREERALYKRKCDATGADIISIYSPDKPYKVYSTDYWYSDHWDATEYGRDFDFNRSFFEQFAEVSFRVPRLQYSVYDNDNCPFVNRCAHCRNCYLCFNMANGEDCYYSDAGYHLLRVVDSSFCKEMQWCANCVESQGCYGSTYLIRCFNVSDSAFCFDCHASSNLILCWNLTNQSYCINNVQYSPEEFAKKKAQMNLGHHSLFKRYNEMLLQDMREKAIHKYANLLKCENCTGDSVSSSKNCIECFNVLRGEELVRVFSVDNNAKFAVDSCYVWESELVCESMSVSGYQVAFSFNIWESSNSYYSELCKSSHNVFGCIGLQNKKYCILNKQYTQTEYEALVPKIIEHMQRTDEWGQFFPQSFSNFSYHESVAQEYFPLTKEQAIAQGFKWAEYNTGSHDASSTIVELPDSIHDTTDDILGASITCEVTGKPFRIIPQELEFYRKMGWPLPRRCPEQRHKDRFTLRNPPRLYSRPCAECGDLMQSSYAPDRSEVVYCEKCYLKQIY